MSVTMSIPSRMRLVQATLVVALLGASCTAAWGGG